MIVVFSCGGGIKGGTADKIAAIDKLAGSGSSGAGKSIAEAAANDPDPAVRKAALAGMVRFTSPQYRKVIEQGTKDRDAGVRASAAATLAAYKDNDAADKLGQLLGSDPDEQVRLAAASGLGMNTSPKALVFLLENAEKNDNPKVQHRAMSLLLPKFGMRFCERVDPRNLPRWRDLVEEMKEHGTVQQAYAACGMPMARHAEDRNVPPSHSDE